jgi:hypothetical protein
VSIMIMSDNNRLHVNIKTTNILVLCCYELTVLFILQSLFTEAITETKLMCNLKGLGRGLRNLLVVFLVLISD